MRPDARYVRDFVYGGIDGTVTTFAVVSGVIGADLGATVIIVLGIANLVADGFSMAASNLLGTRAELQRREHERAVEERHVATDPAGEAGEIRRIFAAKGFSGAELDRVVEVITADREVWVDTVLSEDQGAGGDAADPLRAAATTLVAFIALGCLPLAVFVLDALTPGGIPSPFAWSAVMAAVAFLAVGMLKARFVHRSAWRSGLETLAIGGAAAALAFAVGSLLQGVHG